MNKYFKPAGNLNENESEQRYFASARDLNQDETTQKYFKPAGDLENNLNIADEVEIKSYLESVVSHERLEGAIEGGMIIVSFSKLQELVNSGYNIVSAQYLNPNMIAIEYQKYETERKTWR